MSELRRIEKPTLITVGKQQTVSHGMWNHDCMADWITANGRDRWIEIGELARMVWRHNSESNRRQARRRLPALKRIMATNHNQLLVVQYNGRHNSASAIKLYDKNSSTDQQAMMEMIAEMEK